MLAVHTEQLWRSRGSSTGIAGELEATRSGLQTFGPTAVFGESEHAESDGRAAGDASTPEESRAEWVHRDAMV